MTEAQKESRIAEMTARVQEIKDMDRSTLSSADKKALRHELSDMNNEAKALAMVAFTSHLQVSLSLSCVDSCFIESPTINLSRKWLDFISRHFLLILPVLRCYYRL